MSITFFCPDAPTHFVANDPLQPEDKEEQSTLPCLSLSQDNAYAFLRLMRLPEASEGCIDNADIPAVQQRLIQVANSEKVRRPEHVPPSRDIQPGKVRVIEVGVPDEYFVRRATQFMDLFSQAQEQGYKVVWS